MVVIQKEFLKEAFQADLLYKLHTVKEKVALYEKKYQQQFLEFEKHVENAEEENFEEWDDYIEWKAYQNSFEDLTQQKKDVEDGNFKVA